MAKTYVKCGEFVTRAIADETIVVPIKAGVGDLDSIYTLNDVGATIWGLIDGATTVDGIVAAVVSTFDVGADEARSDVLEFLGSLEQVGVIQPVAGEPG